MKERLVILDGNSLMNRAFYGVRPLTTMDGTNTNAVYGFLNMLYKIQEEIKPDYIVSTFDKKAPTFRHNEYKDYKAGRKAMPDELAAQFPIIKEALRLMAINIYEIDGFEADDIIGTLSKKAEALDMEVFIITGDRDALQLCSDSIKVILTKTGMSEREEYDEKRMLTEYEVTPLQFIDVKGLMGDKSDNIPGVPGIGEKTAYKLIKEYGSIENVLMHIDEQKGKIKENLYNFSEQAIFSKRLATIMVNVPIEIDFEDIRSKEAYDYKGLRELYTRLQFKSLMDKIKVTEGNTEKISAPKIEVTHINNSDELNEKVRKQQGKFQFLYTTENQNIYSKAKIKDVYVKFNSGVYHFNMEDILADKDGASTISRLFNSPDLSYEGFDLKAFYSITKKLGIDIKEASFDVKIAAYLIDPSRSEYDLKELTLNFLNLLDEAVDEDNKMPFLTAHLEELIVELSKKLKELELEKLFYEVEMPLIMVLSKMENRGFRVVKEELLSLGEKFKGEIEKVSNEVYSLSGENFNIGSPKQLGKILFEKLDLPVIKKTKTGYSTNAEVLEELMDKHPIIEKVVYYRQLTKLYSTYVEGLMNVVDVDSKIHTSFNQTVTTTGRLSSTEPNLQNIPIKYEMGREIRKVFVPEEDSIIMSGDYSQIELRVLAHIAGDSNLISAFKEGLDIHRKTASEVFKTPVNEVTSLQRSRAKAVNFGIVYGISDFSLSKDIKVSKKEARNYIDTYFERYPMVKAYMEESVKSAKGKGYVKTILNRIRYIPEIKGSNKILMALGERLAMNTPIQGSAADIIKLAMVLVSSELEARKLKSYVILQVHDELILNVYKEEKETVASILKEKMENAIKLNVPLEVDIHEGNSWYEAK